MVADELDREAERDHPMHESFVNPAKSLALRVADRTPLLWGLDDVATAVAVHGAGVLAAHTRAWSCDVAGVPAGADPAGAAPPGGARHVGRGPLRRPGRRAGRPALVRVLLLAVRQGPAGRVRRRAAEDTLPGADVLEPAEEVTRRRCGLRRGARAAVRAGRAVPGAGRRHARRHPLYAPAELSG